MSSSADTNLKAVLGQMQRQLDDVQRRVNNMPVRPAATFAGYRAVIVKAINRANGSNANAGGKYTGVILYGYSTAGITPDLLMPEGMQVPPHEDERCLILNLIENNCATHIIDLTSDKKFFPGVVVGVTDKAGNTPAGLPIVMIYAQQPAAFPVTVEKDGGTDGNKTTPASWTYTVRSVKGTQLGTAKGQVRPRPNGKAAFQAGSDGYGLAMLDDANGLMLWDAGEVYGTGSCTP